MSKKTAKRGFACIRVTWTLLFAERQRNARNAGEASPVPDLRHFSFAVFPASIS